MTLTKYQRGDLIEGWNDCPVPLAHKEPIQHASLQQEIDTHKVIDILNKLFQCNIDLPEREIKHYETKLVNSVDKCPSPISTSSIICVTGFYSIRARAVSQK